MIMEKKIMFKSFDGTGLVGVYQAPDSTPLKGAFLMMHGIPSEKDEWGFYRDMAAYLEEKGFASFRFDFRCNGESEGGELGNLTISALVNDIEAAYHELNTMLDANCPLYVVGTSCGGGVTIKWSNFFKKPLCHIFLMAPVLDYRYEIFGTDLPEAPKPSLAIPDEMQSALKENGHLDSEIHYGIAMINDANLFDAASEVGATNIPITIFHGDADTVVPYSKTQHIAECFKDKIDLITVPDADHGMSVEGDDDLTAPGTKQNHFFVYEEMVKAVLR
jgi:hypothetical protein